MIVIKNVFGGSKVYIKNVFANAENLVVVYNGGEPIEVTGGGGGSGDVVGPASSTDNAIARFSLTTGKLIQNSGATIDDSGNITATNLTGTNTGDQDLSGYEPLRGADDNYVTDAEKIVIGNTSGTNTGDQDLSVKQDTLVSGSNIKTINSTSLLGAGDISVGAAWGGITGTLSSQTDLQTQLAYVNRKGEYLLEQGLGSSIKYLTLNKNISDITAVHNMVDNRIYATALYIYETITFTGVIFFQGTQGVYTADGSNDIGLYKYNGSGTWDLVANTANNGNLWKAAANSVVTTAFTSTYNATPGVYAIAVNYQNSAQTTAPTIARYNTISNTFGNIADFTNSAKISFYFTPGAGGTLPTSVLASATTVYNGTTTLGLY